MRKLLIVLSFVLAFTVPAHQQTGTVMPVPIQQFLDNSGNPVASGKLYVYECGTTTNATTWSDQAMASPNANPLILDSAGRGTVYLLQTKCYKFRLDTSADATLWTRDSVGSLPGVLIDRVRLAPLTVTIATGAISVSGSDYAVDTESAAAADDLDTVTAGAGVGAGSFLLLRPANVARVVTVRDGVGNIQLGNSLNFALNDAASSLLLYYNGSNWVEVSRSGGTLIDIGKVEGRLTLTTGVPVTTSDVTAATTMYFTPFRGNRIALFDGTTWAMYTFTERSLALGTLTDDLPYDVFIYNNAGTLTLEFTAWTNATTRATALTTQDGVYVKTAATTRRYLGTFRTETTTTTEDSLAKRLLWNYYNRVPRLMRVMEATDSWAYTTATIRQANGAVANQLAFVVGVAEVEVSAEIYATARNSSANVTVAVGIGEDSTSTFTTGNLHANVVTNVVNLEIAVIASLKKYPAVGYHFWSWNEYSAATGTTTWFGDSGTATISQSGIHGVIQG